MNGGVKRLRLPRACKIWPVATPAELRDVFDGPMEGVTRIVVRHERRSAFRWMAILELAFFLVLCAVLIVCAVVLLVLTFVLGEGQAPIEGELPTIRFYRHWHELVIRCQNADGGVISELTHSPATPEEGRALLASMLKAANRAGIVLVETLGGAASETLEVWYGGQPLLAHPDMRDGDQLQKTLEGGGYALVRTDDATEIQKRGHLPSKLGAGLAFAVELLLLPFFFWFGKFRHAMKETLLDLKGAPPEAWILAIHTDRRLTVRRERGPRSDVEHTVDGRDLLGVAYSATLGYDKAVTRLDPSLRLVAQDATIRLPKAPTHHLGRALRDTILVTAVERWEGIPATTTRPTRCPYCGTLYVLAADVTCPSCGASAGALG